MLLAFGILLLNGGDCISPLFADQQSKDCCAKGMCHHSQKKDPCCETIPPATTKYFQATGKVTLDQSLLVVTAAIGGVAKFVSPSLGSFHSDNVGATQWPPGVARSVSLPLLV